MLNLSHPVQTIVKCESEIHRLFFFCLQHVGRFIAKRNPRPPQLIDHFLFLTCFLITPKAISKTQVGWHDYENGISPNFHHERTRISLQYLMRERYFPERSHAHFLWQVTRVMATLADRRGEKDAASVFTVLTMTMTEEK